MPRLELSRFFKKSEERQQERAYARKLESEMFTNESTLSLHLVQSLYEQMKAALIADENDPGDGSAPKSKEVNLDRCPARYIIAAEYLLLTNELFVNLDTAKNGYLSADKSRRIYFTINDAVIRTDYCPAHGHIGNYRAYIFDNGKWDDLSCKQFNNLIHNIAQKNIAKFEDKNTRDKKAKPVERALFKLMKHWAEEGVDVFNQYKIKDSGTSYRLKVPIKKKNNDTFFNVTLDVSYDEQKNYSFYFSS